MVDEVTEKTYQEKVINKSKNIGVLVDFWANWCAPCLALNPILEEITKKYDGKLNIVKANFDENAEIASQLEVKSLPTLIFYRNGSVIGKLTGSTSRERVYEFMERII
ncbi:MAG: thioredoxin [Candidatus Nanoarchaeia archaeon]|nr:thioredoxin [Candidatus Nanoarchaeia archaeon]MDD5587666.1 thioredoxin [Candidatus Nanoarchaeia archaeon]